jgi:MYXO-CTERM domain-containing protein
MTKIVFKNTIYGYGFALVGSLVLLVAPSSAQACGGTFCDNLPDPMPVDQRGEDILFVLDGSTVEVHIRIEYTGEAERFAWLVPLQAIPEVTVGSEPLFDALRRRAGPDWETDTAYDCPEDDPNWNEETTGLTTMGFVPMSDFNAASDDPEIVFQAAVGAFDVVVLQGGTAAEVIDFLDANDYAQDPDAEPILQEYLDDGFLFAAIKLTSGMDVDAIHPLVFRFPGNEPCVPIRLTRIAAEDDMAIRAYFLGQERWVPSNYLHVELNPLAYNWQFPSADRHYELLSMAVDEAGGQAFVTDYVGPSALVDTFDVYWPSWDETAFIGVDPIQAIDLIGEQQLAPHPLIQVLLFEFIPPPPDFADDPTAFWNNIEEYADEIDLSAWDDVAFAAALAERIIDPGMHAADLLEIWPKLTRLSTSISPHEMTVDPVFHTNSTLPDVDRADVTTTEQVQCGGDRIYRVSHLDYADDLEHPVCVPENAAYPGWVDMPYSIRSEQVPLVGWPQIVNDNSEAIEAAYQLHQNGVECIPGDGDDDGDSGDGDPGDGDPGDGDPDGGGDPSDDDGGSTSGAPSAEMGSSVSCGCATERGAAPVAVTLGLLVLGLIGPWRRRD